MVIRIPRTWSVLSVHLLSLTCGYWSHFDWLEQAQWKIVNTDKQFSFRSCTSLYCLNNAETKPLSSNSSLMHHNCLVSEGIRKNVREVHLYVNLHIFVFWYILQFNDKTNYDKVLSYQILTDSNYTFPLAAWSDDARCQTQAWKVLDPYCDIETCTMDKKIGICTVEGTALSVNSIPNTGFLSYPRRTGYETVIHTFPVTMKTSLLSVQKKNSSDWIPPASLNVHSHNENSSHTKGNYYYSTTTTYYT